MFTCWLLCFCKLETGDIALRTIYKSNLGDNQWTINSLRCLSIELRELVFKMILVISKVHQKFSTIGEPGEIWSCFSTFWRRKWNSGSSGLALALDTVGLGHPPPQFMVTPARAQYQHGQPRFAKAPDVLLFKLFCSLGLIKKKKKQ